MKKIVKSLAQEHHATFRFRMSGENQVVFDEEEFYDFCAELINKCGLVILETAAVPKFLPTTRKRFAKECVGEISQRFEIE